MVVELVDLVAVTRSNDDEHLVRERARDPAGVAGHRGVADREHQHPRPRHSGAALDQRMGDVAETMLQLEQEMLEAANNLEFEKAALLRDQIRELKRMTGENPGAKPASKPRQTSYRKGKRRKSGIPSI